MIAGRIATDGSVSGPAQQKGLPHPLANCIASRVAASHDKEQCKPKALAFSQA